MNIQAGGGLAGGGGSFALQSGLVTEAGESGNVTLQSASSNTLSGSITLFTGSASQGSSGSLVFATGAANDGREDSSRCLLGAHPWAPAMTCPSLPARPSEPVIGTGGRVMFQAGDGPIGGSLNLTSGEGFESSGGGHHTCCGRCCGFHCREREYYGWVHNGIWHRSWGAVAIVGGMSIADGGGGSLALTGGAGLAAEGGNLSLSSGASTQTSSGSISILSDGSSTYGVSGSIDMRTGRARAGSSGHATLNTGLGFWAGGAIKLLVGAGDSGEGGGVNITAGSGVSGDGGDADFWRRGAV